MSRSSAPTRTLFGENALQGLRKQRMSRGWRSLKGTISATKAHQGLQPGHERCFGKSPSRVAEATYEWRLKVLEGHNFSYKSPSRSTTWTRTLLWKKPFKGCGSNVWVEVEGPSCFGYKSPSRPSTLTQTLLWKGPSRVQVTKAMYVSSLKALEGHQLKMPFKGCQPQKPLKGTS